jgi:uncharacterized membrane protein
MTRMKLLRRVGWAKAPAAADGIVRRHRAALPTQSNGDVGRRGQRRRTVHANDLLRTKRLCPPYVAALVLTIATTAATAAVAQAPPTDAEILALMKAHCVACHAAEPTHEAFAKAPAGVLLETIPQVTANAARIMTQVVVNRAMPLGNQTGMTDEERDRIAAWIEGRNK